MPDVVIPVAAAQFDLESKKPGQAFGLRDLLVMRVGHSPAVGHEYDSFDLWNDDWQLVGYKNDSD